MKHLLLATLIIATLLAGCTRSDPSGSQNERIEQNRALNDSLDILDSLVNVNKVSDNHYAKQMASQALELAKASGSGVMLAKAYTLMGMANFTVNYDSAFIYYSAGLRICDSIHTDKVRTSLLYNLANVYFTAADFKTATILIDSTIKLANRQKNFEFLSNAYNFLGNLKNELQDTAAAMSMYDSAIAVAKRHNLKLQLGLATLSRSRFEKDPTKSIRIKKEVLKDLEQVPGALEEKASTLVNIGLQFGIADSSVKYNQMALKMMQNNPENEVVIVANNNLAYDFMDRKEFAKAAYCIDSAAIPAAIRLKNYDFIANLYDTRADLELARGNLRAAFDAERLSLKYRIKSEKQQSGRQVRLLAAMLDAQNREIRIQQAEKKLQQSENHLRMLILGFVMILLILLGIVFIIIYRLQKSKIRYQSAMLESANRIIEAEETEKARLGRDFHDVTGQKFTSMEAYLETVEMSDQHQKTKALALLREIGESVRSMTHRMNRAWLERFTLEESLNGMCNDFVKLTGMNLEFSQPASFAGLGREAQIHLFRIVQELLNNAVKHASGAKVSLVLTTDKSRLLLRYSDNGPGFDPAEAGKKGVGLGNLQERVKLMGGAMESDSRPGFGTFYQIDIPLGSKKLFFQKSREDNS